ncbi:Protein SRT-23 [Aphelenchoides avenae]|nr:Protein SRT-23 [Aphelenchus avenae]
MGAILLAFNRCVDIMSHRVAERMFGGWKTWVWLLLPSLYGIHHLVFAKTIIFNGVIGCWHFNPHLGYIDDTEDNFSAHELAVHNVFVLILLTSLYAIFCVRMVWDLNKKSDTSDWRKNVASRKSLFLQVLLISFNHLATAFIYSFMHYVHANPLIATVAQLVWISAHG